MKVCIWDVGDTIYPYTLKPLEEWVVKKTGNVHKKNYEHFDFNPLMRGEVSFETFCNDFCKHSGIVFQEGYISEIDSVMHQGAGDVFPQTRQAMSLLKEQGILNGILSNALPNLVDIHLSNLPLEKHLIFTSFEFGLLKPDEQIYHRLQKEVGCELSQIMFIDNRPENIVAARYVGIKGIVYNPKSILMNLKNSLRERE